jgi:hypothetical protein
MLTESNTTSLALFLRICKISLGKKFRYPTKRERDIETVAIVDAAVTMEVDTEDVSNATSRPLKRQKKITRGQAADAVRRSGRLARITKK